MSTDQDFQDCQVVEQINDAVCKAIPLKPGDTAGQILYSAALTESIYKLYAHAKEVFPLVKDFPLFVGLELKQDNFHFSISKQTPMEGINSNIRGSKKHVLFWDFDNIPLDKVAETLTKIQKKYHLAPITIISTGIEGYYHAYCFKAKKWGDTLKILAETEGVDRMFFWLGIMRGYFTLRIGDKPLRSFQKVRILSAGYPPDVTPLELEHTIIYQTGKG